VLESLITFFRGYPLYFFSADFGGLIGLFMECSLLSVLELFHYLVQYLFQKWLEKWKNSRISATKPKTIQPVVIAK
jgi:hypothetical protein